MDSYLTSPLKTISLIGINKSSPKYHELTFRATLGILLYLVINVQSDKLKDYEKERIQKRVH